MVERDAARGAAARTHSPDRGAPGSDPRPDAEQPVVPDYGGACLSSVVPALFERGPQSPDWLPAPVRDAAQVVLLVLDGLGWDLLCQRRDAAPTLSAGTGGPITSVAPTTTATALTSITTGRTPAEHGVVGYRLKLETSEARHRRGPRTSAVSGAAPGGGGGEVLNVLRWRASARDMRQELVATEFQPFPAFAGRPVPAVTRAEFAPSGFTAAHLTGSRLIGWSVPSALVVETRQLLAAGEPFVYGYYDGLDKVAHGLGLGEHYLEELRTVDRLVGDLVETLPSGGVLVVTSDHGQVEVGHAAQLPGPDVLAGVELLSGEGRFRWLHVRPGAVDDVVAAAREDHGDDAWVVTKDDVVDAGWFGGPLSPEVAGRLGDVALVARSPVAFLDPADTGETRLLARHGSLTAAEVYVPLLALCGR